MTSLLIIAPLEKLQNRINSVLKSFKNIYVIYVSLNKSQKTMDDILKKRKINTDRFFFIDCVTSEKTRDDVLRIEPTRLDLLQSAINSFVKNIKGEVFLIIDSLSTLLIYNDKNKVANFIKEVIESCSKSHVKVVAFTPKTEEELLIKIYHFFDKVKRK